MMSARSNLNAVIVIDANDAFSPVLPIRLKGI